MIMIIRVKIKIFPTKYTYKFSLKSYILQFPSLIARPHAWALLHIVRTTPTKVFGLPHGTGAWASDLTPMWAWSGIQDFTAPRTPPHKCALQVGQEVALLFCLSIHILHFILACSKHDCLSLLRKSQHLQTQLSLRPALLA